MSDEFKDMTTEELNELLKASARQLDNTIRTKMIIEELLKRILNQNKDEKYNK